jgi:hypothetical protein
MGGESQKNISLDTQSNYYQKRVGNLVAVGEKVGSVELPKIH